MIRKATLLTLSPRQALSALHPLARLASQQPLASTTSMFIWRIRKTKAREVI